MDVLRCELCGEVIGTYEPARVTLGDGTELHGSPITLRSRPEPWTPGSVMVHEHCYRAAQPDPNDD